jgi:glycosyltransferase involved in cell wall biosynthesis
MSEKPSRTVLLVTGPAAGGIRGHVSLLRRQLPERGYAVRLAAPRPAPPSLADPTARGRPERLAPDIHLPLTDRAFSALSPRVIGCLASAVRRWRPDVVHAHGYKAGAATAIARAAGLRAPLVVTFHNLWPAGADRLARAVLRAVARRAVLVAVSDAVAVSLRAVLAGDAARGEPRITVIGNGVEIEALLAADRETARTALGLPADEPVIGFFGRLTWEKGPDLALAAVSRLAACGVTARLLVVGEGPERPRLESVAGPEARFLGERDDVPALMAACDAVVIPSRAEGQSVVALEAMAAGRPFVATRVGGLGALAEAAGACLTPPEDPDALAAALRGILTSPPCAATQARAREYVARHASSAAMVGAVAQLYDRAIEGSRR